MENLISIIMAVYNCEKYIEETIESIKKQTYSNWELIIVNDASTDNSLNIIKENIKDINTKVKLISLQQNQGAAIARNAGLHETKGRYVAYIDADDIWKETKLEEQLKFMQDGGYAFTYTSYTYLRENGTKDIRKIPMSLNYKQALKNTAILLSTVVVDTNKIDKKMLEMPNVRRGQDMATWWQILKEGHIAYGFDKRLTIYRRRKNSLSIKKNIALKRTWNLYRNVEKFSVLKSLYYFSFYAYNALKKRIF
jgi:teichuronic acid biosynthesis glycosyltransferase TuaG